MNDMTRTGYVRFQWLDFAKFTSDATGALGDLGLQAFPHLLNMLDTSLWVISTERDRESVIGSTGPYLCKKVTESPNLRVMIDALSSASQALNNSLLSGKTQGMLAEQSFVPSSILMGKSDMLPSVYPWNIDEYDLNALLVLQHLDLAYEQFHVGDFDQALQRYAMAKQLHDHLVTTVVHPDLSILAISEDIGRLRENRRRSSAGGRGIKETARREREAIKPVLLKALKEAKPHERKSRNAVFAYLFSTMRGELSENPPVGFAKGFVMSEAAFKDVVKELSKESPELLQNTDKPPSKKKQH